MTTSNTEAYLLLTIPNTTFTSQGASERGKLQLECVSVPHPEATNAKDRDIYLVFRVNSSEFPIDPARSVNRTDSPGFRTYTFGTTASDPSPLVLTVQVASSGDPTASENLETFDNILGQYVSDFQGSATTPAIPTPSTGKMAGLGQTSGNKDLRGHLVMINEDTGEVVGEVEDRFRIHEDPAMHQRGHENDPIYIEVPDESLSTRDADAKAIEVFAKLVPPDQQNWITKGASIVSHAISMTTSLLITTITTASNLYVSHSQPSPHHSNNASGTATPASAKGMTTPGTPGAPPPLPPRPKALVFLTSEKTRKGLSTVHAISGEAVKVSSKTINLIDTMIRRAIGARPKRQKYFEHGGGAQSLASPALTPRSPSPSRFFASGSTAPPPYTPGEKGLGFPGDNKPPLPPRQPSPVPPALPLRSPASISSSSSQVPPNPQSLTPAHQPKLTNKARILISADLILSTIDDSTRRILDTGTEEIGKVVGHKYGAEAQNSSLLMAGTARNVGLVYVDMRGIGRRALLRRAGKIYVKSQFSSGSSRQVPVPGPASAAPPAKR